MLPPTAWERLIADFATHVPPIISDGLGKGDGYPRQCQSRDKAMISYHYLEDVLMFCIHYMCDVYFHYVHYMHTNGNESKLP